MYFPQTVDWGRGVSVSIIQPFLEGVRALTHWTEKQKELVAGLFHLREENERLTKEVESFEQQKVALKEAQQENVRLRHLLDFQRSSKWQALSAQVIGRDLSHWTNDVVINKGAQDGIKLDMPIVNGDGLVGKVIQVAPRASKVILLIDAESRASALVQETRDAGLAEGDGKPFLKMTYLDLHSDIKVGNTVVTSGLGGIYPKGIPIGEIIQIAEDNQKLSLSAVVKPYVAFSKLEEVLCLVVDRPNDAASLTDSF